MRIDAAVRLLVNDRTHSHLTIDRVADAQTCSTFYEPLDERLVHLLAHDGPGTRGALLALKPERRSNDTIRRCIEVGLVVDDDGILAAELENGALDPDLTGLYLRGSRVQPHADVHRSG